jgi:hypothetical protein
LASYFVEERSNCDKWYQLQNHLITESLNSGTAVSATIPIRGTKGMPSGEPTANVRRSVV